MAEVKKSKVAQSVPVSVTIDRRPAPTKLAPLSSVNLQSAITPPKKAQSNPIAKIAQLPKLPPKDLLAPIHQWPEAKRRRLMWWLVIGIMAIIVTGWGLVVRYELSPNYQKNIFRDITNLFKSIDWTTKPEPTPAEAEIRQYEQQVFPQLTNTNN